MGSPGTIEFPRTSRRVDHPRIMLGEHKDRVVFARSRIAGIVHCPKTG